MWNLRLYMYACLITTAPYKVYYNYYYYNIMNINIINLIIVFVNSLVKLILKWQLFLLINISLTCHFLRLFILVICRRWWPWPTVNKKVVIKAHTHKNSKPYTNLLNSDGSDGRVVTGQRRSQHAERLVGFHVDALSHFLLTHLSYFEYRDGCRWNW